MAKEKKKNEVNEHEEIKEQAELESENCTEQESEEVSECDNLKAEIEKLKDMHMRCAAEYANYRTRTEKERIEIYGNATVDAVKNILPIADSIDMALSSLKDAPDDYKKGLELIKAQLDKSFSDMKVESFGEVGDEFDPTIHNAIARIDDENLGENVISAVFQKGYKCGEKVIRYCMVQIAN